MKTPSKPLFRSHALEKYRTAREQIVLPRLVSSKGYVVLWLLSLLMLTFLVLLWSAQLPIYATGPAIVLWNAARATDATVAVFLPATYQTRIQAGQPVRLHLKGITEATRSFITAVEPSILSPNQARANYGLDASTGLIVTAPSVVALFHLDEADAHTSASALSASWLQGSSLQGSVGEAEIQIGTRPALSVLPWVGTWFNREGS